MYTDNTIVITHDAGQILDAYGTAECTVILIDKEALRCGELKSVRVPEAPEQAAAVLCEQLGIDEGQVLRRKSQS